MYFIRAVRSLRVIERERNVTVAFLLTMHSAQGSPGPGGSGSATAVLGTRNVSFRKEEAVETNPLTFPN